MSVPKKRVIFCKIQTIEASHLFNLALGTAKIQQTSDQLLELVARSWTKIQPCHLWINVLWIQPAFKMQVTGMKRSSCGSAVAVPSSAYCFLIKGLCAQTAQVQCAREAKPHKRHFRLSITNDKVWHSLTYLEGVEERLVSEFDNTLMKPVSFLNVQHVLVEPVSPATIYTRPLLPRSRVRSRRGERYPRQAAGVWHHLRCCSQATGLWCLGETWQDSPALLCFRPFCFGRLKWMMDELPVWILKGLKNVTGLLPFLTLFFWHRKGRWRMWGTFL